jgi:transketolase
MTELNPKLFDKDIEYLPIREGFAKGLVQAGKDDENVVTLCCDLTDSTKVNLFKEAFPNRFFEMGIQEQNMASVASGMAAMGKIPFITSYAMFSPGRNWEQIRTTICYNNQPVKLIGSHAGVSVGPDGGTHQAIEDIGITRVIPNMDVIVPCDSIEAKKATVAIAKTDKPTYIRLAREKTPVITSDATLFEIGKAQIFYEPKEKAKVAIIACGQLVYHSIIAAGELEKDGFPVSVMNLATIKPLDKKGILEFVENVDGVITVEEHQVACGMGSAVSELISQENPKKMIFIGVQDKFGQSGDPDELLEHYGMGIGSIKSAVLSILKQRY